MDLHLVELPTLRSVQGNSGSQTKISHWVDDDFPPKRNRPSIPVAKGLPNAGRDNHIILSVKQAWLETTLLRAHAQNVVLYRIRTMIPISQAASLRVFSLELNRGREEIILAW